MRRISIFPESFVSGLWSFDHASQWPSCRAPAVSHPRGSSGFSRLSFYPFPPNLPPSKVFNSKLVPSINLNGVFDQFTLWSMGQKENLLHWSLKLLYFRFISRCN
jgi:hypothetical protein